MLASAIAKAGLTATLSLAGRVERPIPMPLPTRIGGFGGPAGLKQHLETQAITHVVDATHPFAAQMSHNAIQACTNANIPLLSLTRPTWTESDGDMWTRVPDIASAVAALDRPAARVFLAIGRMHVGAFAAQGQHYYLLRLVDPLGADISLPQVEAVIAKGPFSEAQDLNLLRNHQIDIVVSKNSGGTGAYSKIAAARQLGLPVIMIDRPEMPARPEAHSVDDVMAWLGHSAGTERGV